MFQSRNDTELKHFWSSIALWHKVPVEFEWNDSVNMNMYVRMNLLSEKKMGKSFAPPKTTSSKDIQKKTLMERILCVFFKRYILNIPTWTDLLEYSLPVFFIPVGVLTHVEMASISRELERPDIWPTRSEEDHGDQTLSEWIYMAILIITFHSIEAFSQLLETKSQDWIVSKTVNVYPSVHLSVRSTSRGIAKCRKDRVNGKLSSLIHFGMWSENCPWTKPACGTIWRWGRF